MINDGLTALDPGARMLQEGDLRAVFLPGRGMLGASLKRRGEELLGRVEDIDSFAVSGRTCGIPFLHPWANRLASKSYQAAGKEVSLDSSPLIGHDNNGLPMHGVPWPRLKWQVIGGDDTTLHAQLDWNRDEVLAVFPFPHTVEMEIAVDDEHLDIETTLTAGASDGVPVSFGFHPYFRIPGLPRADWRVKMPEMSQLVLDGKNIPTGQVKPFSAFDENLGEREFDAAFALDGEGAFSLAGKGRRITIKFLEGYPYAQVFAPKGKDFIAFEPMTALANALVSGRGLRVVEPGKAFHAKFRISVETTL